jgi:pyruvate-ferredoxin/flavodoxin oxidoreductase
MTMALTPAHFALGEIRFKKQFSKLPADEANLVPIEEFIDLPSRSASARRRSSTRPTARSV